MKNNGPGGCCCGPCCAVVWTSLRTSHPNGFSNSLVGASGASASGTFSNSGLFTASYVYLGVTYYICSGGGSFSEYSPSGPGDILISTGVYRVGYDPGIDPISGATVYQLSRSGGYIYVSACDPDTVQVTADIEYKMQYSTSQNLGAMGYAESPAGTWTKVTGAVTTTIRATTAGGYYFYLVQMAYSEYFTPVPSAIPFPLTIVPDWNPGGLSMVFDWVP